MRYRFIQFLLVVLVPVLGCQERPDFDTYRAEILGLHKSFIEAHWAKDASMLAEPTSEDYLFVSDGDVLKMSADDVEQMLMPYLAATEFSAYENVSDPIIGFSKDGSLAWSIVQVRVAGKEKVGDRKKESFDTLWAWITLYKRRNDKWLKIADVSTKRPYDATL